MRAESSLLSPAGLAPDRRGNMRAAISGALALVSLVLLENLAGPLLNELVLRFPGIDKALHFVQFAIVFAILAYLLKLAGYDGRRRYALAFAGGMLLAAADETAQMWGPGRNVEAADLAADAAGVAFACSLLAGRGRVRAIVAAAALAGGVWVTYGSHVATRDFARGLRYERQHDFAQARVHYARALARGVRSPGLYNSLGWVEVEGDGDAARAVEYAGTALSMRPNDPDILDTYGWALHRAGRSAEALAPLEKAYAAKPRMFCIHYHLGSVHLALGNRAEAERHFRRQLDRPDTREAVFARQALERMGAAR